MSAGRSKPSLTTFILCSGVLYGNGEETFFPYYKQAWLQDPEYLTYYGDGKNKIPTIHYDDLAMHAKYLIYKPPKRIRYVMAIDYTKKREQKHIIKSISKGLAQGLVQSEETDHSYFSKIPDFDLLSMDLWINPSRIFNEPLLEGEEPEEDEEEEGEEEEFDEDGNPIIPKKSLKLKFDWHCKRGIKRNIKKLNAEFNDTRELRPNKIVL